jgi:hypothetical protein
MVENQIFLLNEQLEQARKHNQSLAKEAAKIIEEIKITRLQVAPSSRNAYLGRRRRSWVKSKADARKYAPS